MSAIVRDGWVLGDPPVPGARPGFFMDGSECFLFWTVPENPDGNADGYFEYPPVEVPGEDGGTVSADIEWPFIGSHATRSDLFNLGFIDTDP